MEIACKAGTYGTKPKMISQRDCLDCEKGGFCVTGSRSLCDVSTYNNLTLSWDKNDCVACPEFSATNGRGATDLRNCTCDEGFTEIPLPNGGFKCECAPGFGFFEANTAVSPPEPARW